MKEQTVRVWLDPSSLNPQNIASIENALEENQKIRITTMKSRASIVIAGTASSVVDHVLASRRVIFFDHADRPHLKHPSVVRTHSTNTLGSLVIGLAEKEFAHGAKIIIFDNGLSVEYKS